MAVKKAEPQKTTIGPIRGYQFFLGSVVRLVQDYSGTGQRGHVATEKGKKAKEAPPTDVRFEKMRGNRKHHHPPPKQQHQQRKRPQRFLLALNRLVLNSGYLI